MGRLIKIILVTLSLAGLFVFWYWAEKKDYFKAHYKDLPGAQQAIFKWQDGDDAEKIKYRFRQHFFVKEYAFPRQTVTKVKLFRNIPILSSLTSKTLKKEFVADFVNFCNDSTNFHWGETTWGINESEYYCRLYNEHNQVVGKIYFCLKECGMTSSRPFAPAMKFGGLSEKGLHFIHRLFEDKTKWK